MKKYTRGFVRVAGVAVLAAIVFVGAFWFARDQIGKGDKNTLASVTAYGGGGSYTSSGPSIVMTTDVSVVPQLKNSTPKPGIECKIFNSSTNRVDPVKHPTVDKMLKGGHGYCGVYGYLLSLYYTFGIKEVDTGKGKMVISPNKKDLNLDLVEWYVKTYPELRTGASNSDQAKLYASMGKTCLEVDYDENQLEKQCKDLAAYKKQGYDCNLNIYGTKDAHSVNVKSVSWNKSKKVCEHKVYDTGQQHDPKINPSTHSVKISLYKPGYYPQVEYPEDPGFKYDDGADYLCCK